MQPFSIEDFRSQHFAKEGFMRGSNFLAMIPAPRCLMSASTGEKAQKVGYLCKAAEIPGYQITASDEKPFGIGPDIKIPFGHAHSDLTLTFYIDTRYDAIDFFHAWIKAIAPSTYSLTKAFNGAYDGEVRYRTDYISDISIGHYSDNSKIAVIKFHEAFPVTVSQVALDWGAGDEVLQLSVTFAYRAYSLELVNEPVTLTNVKVREAVNVRLPTQNGILDRYPIQTPQFLNFPTSVRPGIVSPSSFRIGQLSSLDYAGWNQSNDFAMSIRETNSSIAFKLNSVLGSVLGAAPVQAILRGLSNASSITGALNSLRNTRNSLAGALQTNLGGISSQASNITRSLGRIP